jgi:hypothetical protein
MAVIEGLEPTQRVDPYSWNDEPKGPDFKELATIQWGEACYDFDLTRLWEYEGKLYVADDSGCSCPCPFENTTVEDLTEITKLQDFYDYLGKSDHYGAEHPASVDQQWRMIKIIGEKLSKS